MTPEAATAGDDRALVEACKGREPDAWAQLVHRYQATVESHVIYVLHRYGGSHLIQDHLAEIVQQIWTELYARIEEFPVSEFRSWFSFLRRWRTLDYMRRELKFQGRHGPLPENAAAQRKPTNGRPLPPDEAAERRELGVEVRLCLETIPAKQREFVILYYYKGLSYKDIAGHFGIRVGSVGTLHSRAMRSLRRRLQKRSLP